MRIAELNTRRVRSLIDEDYTAVLPTGSTEQHGPHMPLDTDIYLAEQIALQACAPADAHAAVLPPLSYGYNQKELAFAGTVSLDARTFLDAAVDLGRSLRVGGWRRLLFINGHGWNNDLLRVAVHVLNEQTGFTAACCSYWALCAAIVDRKRESPVPGGMAHACEFETSLMLHLRPSSVDRASIADEVTYTRTSSHHHDLFHKSPVFLPEPFPDMSSTGVIGCPSLASAEKGKEWFDACVLRLSRFLLEFRVAYPQRREIP
jgi:creatinine amidohydrolase